MGLGSAFSIGRSALQASQLGVQVASNNLANAATPGYARQVLGLEAIPGSGASTSTGRGVQFTGVRRQIDEALNARLNGAISDAAAAQESRRILGSIETALNELTDLDLSSELGAFFTSFSELSNGTQSQAQTIEQGELLAGFFRRLRGDLADQRTQLDDRLGALVEQADALASEIAALNEEIVRTEGGGVTTNNPLRDRRDELVRELSQLADISTVEQASGAIDVLVGSSPIVLGARSQGIELREIPAGDTVDRRISVTATSQVLDVTAGEIGGVLASRDGDLDGMIRTLDRLASSVIHEINGLHATGATAAGLTSASSAVVISPSDQTLSLNDPLNRSLSGLDFPPSNGGFLVRVVDQASGAIDTTRIDVDLDGIDGTGAPGFGDDTSIEDLAASLDAISGLTASVGSDGRLQVSASQGSSFSFGDDSSGVLAALGINSYFTGSNAQDIAVRDELRGSPSLLMTGRYVEGSFVENGTALEIAGIQNNAVESLGGESAAGFWRTAVQTFSVRAGSAQTVAEATAIVRDGLESERLAISGVDTDEEALSLIQFQRQYQGAARIISTTNQLLDELFAIV
ncbi:MAG: flagellar hook-associated protein FlgK [Planctomycetota bacterium]